MTANKYTKVCLLSLFCLFSALSLNAAEVPHKLQAALFGKIIGFNKGLVGNIHLYIMDSDAMLSHIKKATGKKSGKAIIKTITSGSGIPSEKPHVIYIGKKVSNLSEVLEYCTKNSVMSITGNPDFVEQGVSLGLSIIKKKPKILLGLKGSKNEKIKWNPVIFKIAKKI